MSSISSTTSLTGSSSSIHSTITADLPRLCDDSDCLYPFGPACIDCTFSLDLKESSKQHFHLKERTDEWVEEMQINRHIVIHAGEEFAGGADELDESVFDSEDSEEEEEEGSVVSEGVSETGYEADSDGDVFSLRSNSPTPSFQRPSLRAIQNISSIHSIPSYLSNSASTTSNLSLTPNPKPTHLSPWLSTIFDYTLHSQVTNTHFAGGADIEQDFSKVEKCKLCGRSLGEATDQHWLKCKFAHE